MYDAILIVSFGGPEGKDEVIPFLENVLRGRNVPRERMMAVAHHYDLFDGVSPINEQNRKLIAALQLELDQYGLHLPIYWGNRNWHPLLPDTLQKMKDEGIENAIAFVTSAYSSYSSCRQYREDIATAREAVGPAAPRFDKLRPFYNHPNFIEANAAHLREALDQIPEERRAHTRIAFTAHSVPKAMADTSRYESQLLDTARLVANDAGHDKWQLVFQSRSGPPTQSWLEPDICDHLRELSRAGIQDVVIAPIGFVSDHMEIVYDLDTEARKVSEELNLNMVRAKTAGTHPAFVRMIRELIEERLDPERPRRFLGEQPPLPDQCAEDCCPKPVYGRP
jgi:ferrochelatase